MKRIIASFLAAALLAAAADSLAIFTELAPPYQMLGRDGKLTGSSTEVVRELQRRTGNTDEIQVVPWIRSYKEILGKPNVMVFSMARSVERDPLFEWIGPLHEVVNAFYVKTGSPIVIRTFDDARRIGLIGVYKEDILDQHLTRLGFTNLDRSLDPAVMVKKLATGRVDAVASPALSMNLVMAETGLDPKSVHPAFTFLQYQAYIAFSKNTPSTVVQAWSQAFEAIHKDGTFERIFHTYFPGAPLPGTPMKPFK